MKVTVYLKSGNKIKLRRVSKFTVTQGNDYSVRGFKYRTRGSINPFHICPSEIEAVVEHRSWFLDFLPV